MRRSLATSKYGMALVLATMLCWQGVEVAHAGIEVLVNGDIKFYVNPGDNCEQSDASHVTGFSLNVTAKKVTDAAISKAFSTPCITVNQPCYFGDMNSPVISGDSVTWTKNPAGIRVFGAGTGYHYGYDYSLPTNTPDSGPEPAETPTPDITHSVAGVYSLDGSAKKRACTPVSLTITPGHTLLSWRNMLVSRAIAAPFSQEPTSVLDTTEIAITPIASSSADNGDGMATDDNSSSDDRPRSFFILRRVTDQDLTLDQLSRANTEFNDWKNTSITHVVEGQYFPNDHPPHVISIPVNTPYHFDGMRWAQWKWEVLEVLIDAPRLDKATFASNEQWSSRIFIATESAGKSSQLPLYLTLATASLLVLVLARMRNWIGASRE